MTRVHHARRGPAAESSRAIQKNKKPYTIVLEAVTQEKKKLHPTLTYTSDAPKGFGFIAAGYPEFTNWCKEQCRQQNLDVHIVSAKPKNRTHADPEKLSHHVHRVGHHFPLKIIHLACSKYGYTYDEELGLQKTEVVGQTNWIAQHVEAYSSRCSLPGKPTTVKETKAYIHGAVGEMFPKIPKNDLDSIVDHAFQEGTNRVGNATELTLARRVQLAVVAHIRHNYTDYDKLLKSEGWMEARQKVEHVSLAVLKKWRDEAEEQNNELEETFREIIVLNDDDDDHDLNDRKQSRRTTRSRATAQNLELIEYHPHARGDPYDRRRPSNHNTLVRSYPPSAPRYGIVARPLPPPPLLQSPHSPGRLLFPLPEPRNRTNVNPSLRPYKSPTEVRRDGPFPSHAPRNVQPVVHEIDGQLYHLEPVPDIIGHPRVMYHSPRAAPRGLQGEYARPPARLSTVDRPVHSTRNTGQDDVLPSVEKEAPPLIPPQMIPGGQRPLPSSGNVPFSHGELRSPKRKVSPAAQDETSLLNPDTKRLKQAYYEIDSPRSNLRQLGPPGLVSNEPMESYRRPRTQPMPQIIDLTSSPHQPHQSRDGAFHTHARLQPMSQSNNFPYVSGPFPPIREVRGLHNGVSANNPSFSYMPEQMEHERHVSTIREYVSFRPERERSRPEESSPRYLRSGVRYGGP